MHVLFALGVRHRPPPEQPRYVRADADITPMARLAFFWVLTATVYVRR